MAGKKKKTTAKPKQKPKQKPKPKPKQKPVKAKSAAKPNLAGKPKPQPAPEPVVVAQIPDEQWNWFAGFDKNGKMLTLREYCNCNDIDVFGLDDLTKDQLTQLTISRIEAQPKFNIVFLNASEQVRIDKEAALDQLRNEKQVAAYLRDVEKRVLRDMIRRAKQGQLHEVHMPRIKVVTVDADSDDITGPPFQYRNAKVYPAFNNGNFDLQNFSGPTAKNAAIDSTAVTPIDYLTGSGHGRSSIFMGFRQTVVYGLSEDDMDEPKGRIVHFLACETAIELGPDFVDNGCDAFFGYNDVFAFPDSNDDEFFECDSSIDLFLAEGFTAGETFNKTIALFNQRIADLRNRGSNLKAGLLEANRDRLIRLGKANARLFTPTPA